MKNSVMMVVAGVSVMTCISGCDSDPLDPEAYRKLSEKKWEKIYKANGPGWSIEERVTKDDQVFRKAGEKERRRLFKELQEEVED